MTRCNMRAGACLSFAAVTVWAPNSVDLRSTLPHCGINTRGQHECNGSRWPTGKYKRSGKCVGAGYTTARRRSWWVSPRCCRRDCTPSAKRSRSSSGKPRGPPSKYSCHPRWCHYDSGDCCNSSFTRRHHRQPSRLHSSWSSKGMPCKV